MLFNPNTKIRFSHCEQRKLFAFKFKCMYVCVYIAACSMFYAHNIYILYIITNVSSVDYKVHIWIKLQKNFVNILVCECSGKNNNNVDDTLIPIQTHPYTHT